MLDEEIDTNSDFSNRDIPDGTYSFRVMSVRKNGAMYIWHFSYDGEREGDIVFFANNMGPLLKVLGCKETKPGFYKLESQEVEGVPFKATVYGEPDKKDKNVIRKRMKDFDPVPF